MDPIDPAFSGPQTANFRGQEGKAATMQTVASGCRDFNDSAIDPKQTAAFGFASQDKEGLDSGEIENLGQLKTAVFGFEDGGGGSTLDLRETGAFGFATSDDRRLGSSACEPPQTLNLMEIYSSDSNNSDEVSGGRSEQMQIVRPTSFASADTTLKNSIWKMMAEDIDANGTEVDDFGDPGGHDGEMEGIRHPVEVRTREVGEDSDENGEDVNDGGATETQHSTKLSPEELAEKMKMQETLVKRIKRFARLNQDRKVRCEALRLLCRIIKNVLDNPSEEKYRRINAMNPKLRSVLTNQKFGKHLIRVVGFELDDGFWILRDLEAKHLKWRLDVAFAFWIEEFEEEQRRIRDERIEEERKRDKGYGRFKHEFKASLSFADEKKGILEQLDKDRLDREEEKKHSVPPSYHAISATSIKKSGDEQGPLPAAGANIKTRTYIPPVEARPVDPPPQPQAITYKYIEPRPIERIGRLSDAGPLDYKRPSVTANSTPISASSPLGPGKLFQPRVAEYPSVMIPIISNTKNRHASVLSTDIPRIAIGGGGTVGVSSVVTPSVSSTSRSLSLRGGAISAAPVTTTMSNAPLVRRLNDDARKPQLPWGRYVPSVGQLLQGSDHVDDLYHVYAQGQTPVVMGTAGASSAAPSSVRVTNFSSPVEPSSYRYPMSAPYFSNSGARRTSVVLSSATSATSLAGGTSAGDGNVRELVGYAAPAVGLRSGKISAASSPTPTYYSSAAPAVSATTGISIGAERHSGTIRAVHHLTNGRAVPIASSPHNQETMQPLRVVSMRPSAAGAGAGGGGSSRMMTNTSSAAASRSTSVSAAQRASYNMSYNIPQYTNDHQVNAFRAPSIQRLQRPTSAAALRKAHYN